MSELQNPNENFYSLMIKLKSLKNNNKLIIKRTVLENPEPIRTQTVSDRKTQKENAGSAESVPVAVSAQWHQC